MKFYAAASLLLAGVSSVLANPLEIRSSGNYQCDVNGKMTTFSSTYIASSLKAAAATKANLEMLQEMTACDISNKDKKDMGFCQPKDFKNHGGVLTFPACPSGPWKEWPLMSDGKTVFGGGPSSKAGPANPVRLIFTGSKFCGVITHHASAGHGNFISCTAV